MDLVSIWRIMYSPQAKVGEYYNAHFLNLQLDAEKVKTGKWLRKHLEYLLIPLSFLLTGVGGIGLPFLGG